MTDLKYKLEHGLYVKKEKITLMEWYETWLEEYKKNRVKIGTYTSYEKYYKSTINNRLGKGYFEDTPKTRTSTRDIPLTAAITEHIEAQRKYWGFKVVRMDQYLFCNENGDPISRERIQGEIDRIIKRIKSDGYDFPRITSHVFRHTFATRAIEAGMPPQVLKTILGHSSLAMTMDLYSHVLPDTKADEMQKIANVF